MDGILKFRQSSYLNKVFPRKNIIWFSAGLFSIAAGYSVALLPKHRIMQLTAEDGVYENTGAFFFLLTAVLFFSGFLKSKEENRFLFQNVRKNYSMLTLAVMFFIIFGEEISWGQRILNFGSGNFFITNNMQQETNIHNLQIFHALDENEVKKEWWQYFSLNKLFRFFWLIWCIIIPVAEKLSPQIRVFRQAAGIPAVSFSFGFLFLINYSVLKILETKVSSMTEVVEIEECITAILFFILAFRLVTEKRNDHFPDAAKERSSILSENAYGERAKPRTK
jgi:hypothetical protein